MRENHKFFLKDLIFFEFFYFFIIYNIILLLLNIWARPDLVNWTAPSQVWLGRLTA